MKRYVVIIILLGLLAACTTYAQIITAFYTNAPSGATVTLPSDVSVSNTDSSDAAGITFSGGLGDGELAGSGNLSIYNIATETQKGADKLYGIYAGSFVVTQYTGNITVVNNRSSLANARVFPAYAYGIHGDVTGDLSGTINATTSGGTGANVVFADADAYGIDGDITGDLTGTINATASGGIGTASAFANAYGIVGDVTGDLTGALYATASGGTGDNANVWADGVHGNVTGDLTGMIDVTANGGIGVDAWAIAGGINGGVTGDLTGTINATAIGGTATSTNSTMVMAKADAYGIDGAVTGNILGNIYVSATGGTATGEYSGSVGGTGADASADAYGLGGWFENVECDISGAVSSSAMGGTASEEASADASAFVVGILGYNVTGNIAGSISVTAVGGNASTSAANPELLRASASSSGIDGMSVVISNFTGNISARSVAGVEMSNGVSHVSDAVALGIFANDVLYLNAPAGSIHAGIEAPVGYVLDDLAVGSVAYAIGGGRSNDIVRLGDVDIVGDINLGVGTNRFEVFGDARIEGNIYADYTVFGLTNGWNDFEITSGLLTPVGCVRISDLLDRKLKVGADGGFAFDLYETGSDTRNPKLMVDGQVLATNGASIAAYAAAGQTAQKIVGKSYEVVTATDGIDGTFVENTKSLFDLDIVVGETNIVITPTGIKGQVGENTPTGNGVTQASIASANRAINNLSQHAGTIRSMLRSGNAPQSGSTPQGAAGPSLAQQELTSGEWATVVRPFNDMGSQDSEGGIAGYDWNSSGFLVGFEKLIGSGLVVGTSGGGAWTDLDGLDGSGGGASEMFVGSVFVNAFSETWYSEAGLSYAHAWNDAERIASDTQRYMGEYESDLFGGWLELGYTLAGEKYSVEPYGRGTYLNGQHDGYTDKGGTNPLTVDSSTSDNLLTELGIRTIRDWQLGNGNRLRTAVKAGWQCEWMDDTITANGTLLGASQRLTSPEADRNALVLGLNADWQLTDKVFIVFDYEPTLSGNRFNHSVIGEIKVVF